MKRSSRHFLSLAAVFAVAFPNIASACSTDRSIAPFAMRGDARPEFIWPVKGRVMVGCGSISSNRINIAALADSPIEVVADGVVAYAGNELKDYGNLVLVSHANGFVTAYAHANKILVKRGEHVKRGQVIAILGQTGHMSQLQLLFEIRRAGESANPLHYLPKL